MQVYWGWIPSAFVCLRISLFPLQFWRTTLPETVFLVGSFLSFISSFRILNISSHSIFSLFFVLFAFCSSDWMTSSELSSSSLILSSVWSSLLLNRSFEFFTSLILQLYNFFLVFLYFFFQLKFSLCSCIALLTSVSILMTSILNYLTGNSDHRKSPHIHSGSHRTFNYVLQQLPDAG